jgi:hypothetical protein
MKVRCTLKDGEPIPAEKAVDVERLEIVKQTGMTPDEFARHL